MKISIECGTKTYFHYRFLQENRHRTFFFQGEGRFSFRKKAKHKTLLTENGIYSVAGHKSIEKPPFIEFFVRRVAMWSKGGLSFL